MSNFIKLNGKTFECISFNYKDIEYTELVVKTDSVATVVDAFRDIQTFDLYEGDTLISTYNSWSSYNSINITQSSDAYNNEEENTDVYVSIILKPVNLEKKVKKLNDQINPVYNPETMTDEELRDYVKKITSEKCRETIYKGCDITLLDESVEHFTFNADDQVNLKELFDIVYMTHVDMPYHKNGDDNNCKIYDWKDIITIYQTLSSHKFYHTTYQNAINNYLPTETDREKLLAFKYGDALPQEYVENIEKMVAQSKKAIETIFKSVGLIGETVTKEPEVEKPATGESITENPETDESETDKPTIDESEVEETVTVEPETEESATEKSETEEIATEEQTE